MVSYKGNIKITALFPVLSLDGAQYLLECFLLVMALWAVSGAFVFVFCPSHHTELKCSGNSISQVCFLVSNP